MSIVDIYNFIYIYIYITYISITTVGLVIITSYVIVIVQVPKNT